MVFLIEEINFLVKFFWPHRSNAKGFAIENLAHKYREKISSFSTNKNSSQLLNDRNFKSTKEDHKNLTLSNLLIKRGHWANRDFSEYREAA